MHESNSFEDAIRKAALSYLPEAEEMHANENN